LKLRLSKRRNPVGYSAKKSMNVWFNFSFCCLKFPASNNQRFTCLTLAKLGCIFGHRHITPPANVLYDRRCDLLSFVCVLFDCAETITEEVSVINNL
jgi:hypothetical protein